MEREIIWSLHAPCSPVLQALRLTSGQRVIILETILLVVIHLVLLVNQKLLVVFNSTLRAIYFLITIHINVPWLSDVIRVLGGRGEIVMSFVVRLRGVNWG